MCIRDRLEQTEDEVIGRIERIIAAGEILKPEDLINFDKPCLLYTSDAADERSSVDLGGRRIIKKKKQTLKT